MPDDFDITADGDIDEIAPEEPEGLGEEPAEEGGEPAAASDAAPAPATATPAPPATEEPPWRKYLTPREGETPQQVTERLARERYEQSGRANRAEREAAERLAAVEEQIATANKIYSQFYQVLEARAAAEAAEANPEPDLETNPAAALAARIDKLGERMTQREQAELAARDEAVQGDRAVALQEIDAWAESDVSSGLGMVEGQPADPEFQAAFDVVERVQWADLGLRYPDATEEQKVEAMNLLRKIEGRKAATSGYSLRDFYKRRASVIREATGAAAPAVGKAKAGTPTPAEIARQAAAAGRAGGVRRVRGGTSVTAPKTLEDFAKLPEEEQAKLIAAGKVDEASLWSDLAEEGWH